MPAPTAPLPRARRWKRWLRIGVAVLALWWAAGLLGAHLLTRAWPRAVPARSAIGGAALEAVATTTADGVAVRGWLVRGTPSSERCVVLASGVRGSRIYMEARAAWYVEHGWSALLVDLRGTGESTPTRISMGWNEALDLVAWHAFLGTRGYRDIAVHGQSLGAAAAVYSVVRGEAAPRWHFVVLEACYRDIRSALAARLPAVPEPLLWPMLVCSELLLGVDADDLDPLRHVSAVKAPTLFVCGTADRSVGPSAADALFAASGAARKERCDLPGIAHVDLWSAGGGALPRALASFLARL